MTIGWHALSFEGRGGWNGWCRFAGGPDDFPQGALLLATAFSENRRPRRSRKRSRATVAPILLLLRNTDDFAAERDVRSSPSPQNRRCHPWGLGAKFVPRFS